MYLCPVSAFCSSVFALSDFPCRYHTTKEKFHEFIDSGWQRERAGKGNEETVPKGESPDDSLDQICEPPEKKVKVEGPAEDGKRKEDKKRARGQFKSRPHMKPHSYDDLRLCPSIIQVFESISATKTCFCQLCSGIAKAVCAHSGTSHQLLFWREMPILP